MNFRRINISGQRLPKMQRKMKYLKNPKEEKNKDIDIKT